MEVVSYINSTFEEEKALVIDGTIVLHGDFYHDRIDEQISAFIACLNYLNKFYAFTENKILFPSDELFNEIGFCDNSEDRKD